MTTKWPELSKVRTLANTDKENLFIALSSSFAGVVILWAFLGSIWPRGRLQDGPSAHDG